MKKSQSRRTHRGKVASLLLRVVLVIFALCATITLYLVHDETMRECRNAPQREVEVHELLQVREGGVFPPRVQDQPCLRTSDGEIVHWEASLGELAEFCRQGLPFRMNVYEMYGGLYYYSSYAARGWLIFSMSLFLFSLHILFWPVKRSKVEPVACISKRGASIGMAVTDKITFDLSQHERHRRIVFQVVIQGAFAVLFVGWMTYAWGWSWLLLAVALPVLLSTALVCWPDALVRFIDGALLLCVPFLAEAFGHGLYWRETTRIEAIPRYVRYDMSHSADKKHGTPEEVYEVLFSYDWAGRERYGFICLRSNQAAECALIRQLRGGHLQLLRDQSPEGRFFAFDAAWAISQLVSGAGALFCFLCGGAMLLLGQKKRRTE